MSGKATEAGKAFLAGVLAKLPAEQRAQAEAILLSGDHAEGVLTAVGDGALARSDYSRLQDELATQRAALTDQHTELTKWYGVNQTALQDYTRIKPEYDRLKAGGGDDDTPPAPPIDPRKAALEVVNEAGQEYVMVSAWLAGKAVQHQSMFGEPLDTMALVQNPKLGKPIPGQPGRVYSLNDAYTESFGEKVAAKATEAEAARIDKLVEERLTERMKGQANHPFPIRGQEPSALDALDNANKPLHTVDSATAMYEQLQNARST